MIRPFPLPAEKWTVCPLCDRDSGHHADNCAVGKRELAARSWGMGLDASRRALVAMWVLARGGQVTPEPGASGGSR